MSGTTPSRLRFTSLFVQTSLLFITSYFNLSRLSCASSHKAFIVVLQGFIWSCTKSVGRPPPHLGDFWLPLKVAANWAPLGFYATNRSGGNYCNSLPNNSEERSSLLLISRYYVCTLLVPKMFSLTAKLHNSTQFDFPTALGKWSK